MLRIFLTIFCGALVSTVIAQSNIDDLLQCTNDYLGADDFIVNGSKYLAPNSQITGNVYYESWSWRPGIVFIESTPYPMDNLKYDIFQDQLITQRNGVSGVVLQMILNASIIDSFLMDNRLFINSKHLDQVPSDKQYIEKIGTNHTLYRLQSVFYSAQFNRRNPAGRFQYSTPKFYQISKNGVQKIKRLNDLADLYPDHKKEIQQYGKQSKMKLNRASHAQISQLLKMIDAL